MLNIAITIFQNITETKKPYIVTPEQIVQRIKTGKSKELIEKIRTFANQKERNELKKNLPCIVFAGEFTARNDNSLTKHSGLIALDFDHVSDPIELKKDICKSEYVFMAFISPSGDGVKIVVKIPANAKTHAASALALCNHFAGINAVDHFADLSRVCYESYDPEIYYNPNSKIFEEIIQKEKTVNRTFETDQNVIFEKIEKWLQSKGEYYVDGNKHKYLVKITGACNRFGLSQSFIEQRLFWTYNGKASHVDEKDFIKIVQKVYSLYHNQFASAVFEKTEIIEKKTKTKINIEDLNVDLPLEDIIYLNDIKKLMYESYEKGTQSGETTYFDTINPHFTWKKGDLTLVHGIGNHGKSIFVMNLALIKTVKEGIKWGVFSPEQNPPTDFYNDLIHTYIGEATEPFYNNQMSLTNYELAMKFVNEHFYYIYPETKLATPEYINMKFVELIKKHNIEGCIIDPFNQLDHNWKPNTRDDRYLSIFLQDQKKFAIDHNIYMVIIAHPRGSLQKKKDGNYEIPQVYDLAGGAMWNNKCDNILAIHKPFNITDPKNTEVLFISQKIKKQRLVGRPGQVSLDFNIPSNRFRENGYSPFDTIFALLDEKKEPIF